MSESSYEYNEQIVQETEAVIGEEKSAESVISTENETETTIAIESNGKMSQKKIGIIVASAIAVVIVIIVAIILIPSKFDKVEKECLNIAGQIGSGKDYFSLDTDPYENADETVRMILLPNIQKNTLKAIKYANSELGFPGSVYSDMIRTSSAMGRQSEENSRYKVSWTYHPDHGLEVTYTKK